MKQSGLGREGSKYGMDEYLEVITNLKFHVYVSICVWLSGKQTKFQGLGLQKLKLNQGHRIYEA